MVKAQQLQAGLTGNTDILHRGGRRSEAAESGLGLGLGLGCEPPCESGKILGIIFESEWRKCYSMHVSLCPRFKLY